LFDVSALSGIPQTYIEIQASQYDTYSYLFTNPTFVSLDPTAAPSGIVISGMRFGVNGVIPTAGQSYATLNATVGPPSYTPAGGQVLSTVGAIVPVDQGPAGDAFFLSFDQFGSFSHTFVEPTYTATGAVPSAPVPDMGIATFERIYHTMSGITGVPFTNTAVTTVYQAVQQSMPSAPQIAAFLPSHQTAISQMAGVYCAQLVGTPSTFSAFFGSSSLSSNLNATSASYFGTTGAGNAANISNVVGPLVNAIVGPTAYPQAAAGMTAELNLLLPRIGSLNSSEKVSDATIAACTAALGSAAATVQ
ncbi:MAG TPA: hypothetical protein VGC34_05300, partial [Steroidobacteraceae bacterium]